MVDRTTNNNRTDQKRYRLVSLVHCHRGHIKTDVSMKDKWSTILQLFTAIYSDMSFKSYTGIQTQFERIHTKEMLTLGITKPGSNSLV